MALIGCAAGIFALPPLLNLLITSYGWRGAVLIQGALIFNIVAIGVSVKQKPLKQTQTEKKQNLTSRNDKPQLEEETKLNVKTVPDCETDTNASKMSNWYPSHLILLINTPMIILVYSTSFFVNLSFSAALIHTTNQIVLNGYSDDKAALALSLLGIGSIIGRLVQGVLLDAHILTPKTLHELTLLLAAAATFINPILNNYVGFMVSAFCIGFSSGILFTVIYTIMMKMVGASEFATAIGMELFVDCIGIMAGGYLAGKKSTSSLLQSTRPYLCRVHTLNSKLV